MTEGSDHVRCLDAAPGQTSEVAESHEETSFDYEEWKEYAVALREDHE